MDSFEELYNQSLKEDKKLDKIVTGTIINITSKGEIFVDLGYKADGIIPKSEYSFDIEENPLNEFKIGDKITAEVLKMNDGVGNVLLSYKKLKQSQSKERFAKRVESNEIFNEKISQINEKGAICDVNGIRVFIPISLSGINKGEKLEEYIGKNIEFKVIEFEPENRKVIGSKKILVDEEKQRKEIDFWNKIEVGQKFKGIVVSITGYGAFIDLGGVQGLLHVSDITWKRNADVNKYLSVGQDIDVEIKEIDKDNKKIKLSYPQKEANPWESVSERYNVNDIVNVTIKKFMPFGVFAELEEGIDGLIHVSQISNERIAKPEEKLELNQKVDAKIIGIDLDKNRIELSIKQVNPISLEDELKGVEGVTLN